MATQNIYLFLLFVAPFISLIDPPVSVSVSGPLFFYSPFRFSQIKASLPAGKMANSASGMAVHDDCKLKFQELKSKRVYRYIVFKIEENLQQVMVEKVGEPHQSYDDFTASLPANECRYAVFDLDFTTSENVNKSKIFFIAWSPETSRVRSKMIYSSSKDRFRRELDGVQVELQATDPAEMSFDIVKDRAYRTN